MNINMTDEHETDPCKERCCIFMKCLYEEKNIHKNHRFKLIQRKLLFIGALLGFGSLHSLDATLNLNFRMLLYLVPFIAIAYDIYILAEDFKVKRVGAFISRENANICPDEKLWERFVRDNREPLAAFGTILLTVLASLFAVVLNLKGLLSYFESISQIIFQILLIVIFIIFVVIYVYYYIKFMESNKRLDEKIKTLK